MRKIVYEDDNITLDEGILFGRGVFETIQWDKNPIFLKEHLERMKASMKLLGLEELEEDVLTNFLEKQNIVDKVVKILVTPKNIIITKRKNQYRNTDYQNGFTLRLSKVIRNSTSNLCYIKSINYIENIIEKNNAMENGYNDAIFLNEKEMITETSCANIFIIKNNIIQTPNVGSGLLSGIVREFIISKFRVEELNLSIDDIKSADEVFITNSIVGVMPVVKIDNTTFNIGNKTIEVRKIYEETRKLLGGN